MTTQIDRPLLTIGMATIDDFEGVYFTITSLMIHHAEVMEDCELLVVDNNPGSKQGQLIRDWVRGRVPRGRYIPFDGPQGTSQAREEVFRRARGAAVLCIDCHVLLVPGALERLIAYYRAHPLTRDLLSGPLLRDCGRVSATHQRPQWSKGAWGVWSIDERGKVADSEPFEIWQQGMGLFSCRRKAWVGFHPEFRGFGGCESYIMEKFRQRGGKVLCCPWLRWTHRFQRPHGVPYAITNEDRVRNYLIGFEELGLDVQSVLNHFGLSREQARRLVSAQQKDSSHSEFAVVGNPFYGGVVMRGRTLARQLACKRIRPHQVSRMRRRGTIVAIKCGPESSVVREKCDRLIYDPLDVFAEQNGSTNPIEFWRSAYRRLHFDEIIATSPACFKAMRQALPAEVAVHLVPHQCDPRVDTSWHNPDGPIAYAGLQCFIRSGLDRIKRACQLIKRDFVIGPDVKVLRGASLALALRLPPYDSELNRHCKPQIKLENAAAAGLPVVATDCPAAVSLHPDIATVPVGFSAAQLAAAMRRALAGPAPSKPYRDEHYLAAMNRILLGQTATRKAPRDSTVVFTAIFGDYDVLREPRERTPGVRYVCFTDNPRLRSDVWQIRYCPPEGDPALQAKRIKIMAHEALNCERSLWIDGSVELRSLPETFERVRSDLALLPHPERNCIYAEANHCKLIRRGDPRQIDRAVSRYQAEGHPLNYGLWMGGLILRRHTPAIAAFNAEWWREVQSGTTRDQIILPVVLRRLGISFEPLFESAPRVHFGNHSK